MRRQTTTLLLLSGRTAVLLLIGGSAYFGMITTERICDCQRPCPAVAIGNYLSTGVGPCMARRRVWTSPAGPPRGTQELFTKFVTGTMLKLSSTRRRAVQRGVRDSKEFRAFFSGGISSLCSRRLCVSVSWAVSNSLFGIRSWRGSGAANQLSHSTTPIIITRVQDQKSVSGVDVSNLAKRPESE